jgi:hypothetical protein
VDSVVSQDEQALHAQLEKVREKLDFLARDLRAVDSELEGLSKERGQYRLLHEACSALEDLSAAGAAGMFFCERLAGGEGDDHLRLVRSRVDVFQEHLGEVEGRRQAVVEKIRYQQENTDLLEEDLCDAREREEQRKLEWLIERELDDLPSRPSVMPWSGRDEDDARFRKSLAASLLVSLLLGLLLPMIDLPLPEPWKVDEVPERLARLIREERPLPPPPPQREVSKPVEELLPEEGTKPASQETPKPSAEPKGILAFREKFSGLAQTRSSTRLGAQARITKSGESASRRPERSMVATHAPGSSGGINLAALSRDVGGGDGQQLEGVQVARATSTIGGISGPDRPLSDGPGLGRTDEEIQIVFDRHKAALYRLYNRELRRDPTLSGQIVLRIRIEPDGSVSLCELQASDMDAPQLSAKVVDRVQTFDFGAKEVSAVTILYPIDFLPAT